MNLGIIGTGSRTSDYMNIYHSGAISDCNIKALADISEPRLKEFSGKYFQEGSMPDFYTDYRHMLDDNGIDAVLICTPDTTHKEIALACLEKEKHILLEKPLATNLKDCLDIYRESLKHNNVFQLAFGMRHCELYKKIKEIAASGEIGRIISVEAKECLGYIHAASFFRRWQRFKKNNGGFLNYKCCHDIDLLNWIIGSKPVYVSAFGNRSYFNPVENAAPKCRDCGMKTHCKFVYKAEDYYPLFGEFNCIEDICVFNCEKDIVDHEIVSIVYENNVTVGFTVSMLSAEANKTMVIFGSEATLTADLLRNTIEIRYIHPYHEVTYRFGSDIIHNNTDVQLLQEFSTSISNPCSIHVNDAEAGLFSSGIAILAEISMDQKKVFDVCEMLKLHE